MSIRNELLEDILEAIENGSGSARVPVEVSGSPFVDFDALDTWSQANQSELLNNETNYAVASLDDDTNYEWEGVDGVYSASGWFRSSGLNNEEQEAVDSIVDAPDNEILVTDSGTLVSKGITVSDTDIDTNGRSITVSVGSLNLGGAQSISAAGRNVATKDLVSQDSRHSVWQTFEDGNTAIVRVRTTLPPITVSDKTADLVNPVWTQAAATVDQTVKQVVLDFTNAVTNFVVELDIDGVDFFKENLGDFSSGEQTVVLNPPTDVFQGDVVTFKLTSEDGDVTVKGNSGTGVPYQVATIASWVDESISGGSGDVAGPNSSVDTELTLFNGTSGKVIEGGSQIKASIGTTDANLIIGTSAASGTGFPSIDFNDVNDTFLGSIRYDEQDFELDIVSDDGVSISASGDAYIVANGLIEIQSTASTIDITSNGDIAIDSGTGAMSLTASGAISNTTSGNYTVVSSDTVSLTGSNDISINGADTTEINSGNDMTLTSTSGDINTSSSTVNMSVTDLDITVQTNGFTLTPSSNAVYGFGFNGSDSSISQNPTTNNFQISSAAGDMTCQVLNGFSMNFSAAQNAAFNAALGDFNITAGNDVIVSANGETLTFDGANLTFNSTGIDQKILFNDAVFGYDNSSSSTILGTNNNLRFQIINGDWNTTSQQGIEMLASTTLKLDCTAGNTILNADTNLALTGNTVDSTAAQALTLNSTNSNVEINANSGEVQLSADSGNSAITLGANSTIASDVQLNIVGGAECSFGAGLSLNMSSSEGIYLATGVDNQFPVSFANSGTGGGRCDQHVIDFDPDGVLTALNGAVAYRVDAANPANIKEYRLKATGAGFFNTPWVEIGGSGSGNVTSSTAISIDTALSVYDGTSGETIKQAANITTDGESLSLSPEIANNDYGIYFNSTDAKLEIDDQTGSLTMNTTSGDVNIQGDQTVAITSTNGALNLISNSASGVNISAGFDNVFIDSGNDVIVSSNNNDSTQALVVLQNGSNGGQFNLRVSNRAPVLTGSQGDVHFRQGSSAFQSDMFICDQAGTNSWIATKGRGAPYLWGNSNVQSGTTTRYLTPGNDDNNNAGTSEDLKQIPITRNGFLHNMRILHGEPDGNGNNIEYRLRVDGVNTTMLVNIASTASQGASTTRIAVSAGDLISIQVTKASGVNNSPDGVKCMIDFY